MCGIAGILRVDGGLADPAAIEPLVDALAHRGPDGRGRYVEGPVAFGHLRLSILDPSPAGAQPMCRDGVVLVHNGEIYNYLELAEELRAAGETFSTGTDTEVILAAYRVWGLDAIARLNGIFAFAIWDPGKRRLVLARDPMGVKPMYLRRTSRSLIFASEIGGILASRAVDAADPWSPQPHPGAVHDFLGRGKLDSSLQTFVTGVTAHPPGHMTIIEDRDERTIPFWRPPPLADDARPAVRGADLEADQRLIEGFRERFDGAVRRQLRSDVPIGTCLSGGLDSSSIVATIEASLATAPSRTTHEAVPRMAFHARFPADRIDESWYADLVARRAGMGISYVTPRGSPLLRAVLPVLRAQGEPYGSASINAQFAVMRDAHQHGLKVLLDGQGADELLGGYYSLLGVRTAGLLLAGHPMAAIGELRSVIRRRMLSPLHAMTGAVQGALGASSVEAIRRASSGRFGVRCSPDLRREPSLERIHTEPGTLLARRLWQQTIGDGLPSLLRYEDRNSMAFGIEARVPFLDLELVEFVLRLPDRLRIDRAVTKSVLREAMRGRLPEEVRNRRDKLGFTVPQRAWLREDQRDVATLVREGQLVGRGWVESSEIERVLDGAASGRRAMEQLWRLFITEAWLRLTWPHDIPSTGREVWDRALLVASHRAV